GICALSSPLWEQESLRVCADAVQLRRDGTDVQTQVTEPGEGVADERECADEADSRRRDFDGSSQPFHLEPHKVVSERDTPEFLADTIWRLAADALLPLKEV